ncbi:MAG TPA: PDZ domain-containing protein [Rhodanobacteraceae bacterium]|nr:PDZ domain-containing protein [Rhodanobacteraceae bacterium]
MKERTFLRRTLFALIAASIIAAAGSALAAGEEQAIANASAATAHSGAAAGLTVEQRVREELSVVMMDLIQSGAFGSTAPQQIALDVDAPAKKVSNLGLLVDSKHGGGDGLHVLAVTPGGNAERMGLRAGDVLVALNGTSLATSDGAAVLRRTVDTLPEGGKLAFDLRRDGRAETVGGTSASMYLPAMHLSIGEGSALASNGAAGSAAAPGATDAAGAVEGCGRISDFDVAPRGKGLHGAKIITIDDKSPGPSGAKAYRVDAGRHVLKIGEKIESRYLSFNDRQRNARIGGGYKTLTVEVAPDTTYLVAARLNEDQRDNPANGAYWDPVVYQESPEACR